MTSAPPVPPAPPVDGRTARALRTREAIVEASIALVADGELRPTAPRIAERAQVSVRSVFQHFEDLEGLYSAVADRLVDRLSKLRMVVDASAPLAVRIDAVVLQRTMLLEALTPVRQAANVHAPFSPEVQLRLQSGHDFLRAEIAAAFAPELVTAGAGLGPDSSLPDGGLWDGGLRDGGLLDALDTVLSWSAWENLRLLNGRDLSATTAVMRSMLRATLQAAGFDASA